MLDDLIPKVDVPPGSAEDWRVERFRIRKDEADAENLRMILALHGGRRLEPGTYTRLVNLGLAANGVVMSDTHAERWDHYRFVRDAFGTVLINGLGLGVVVNALVRKPEVRAIVVQEKAQAVIRLVGEHYYRKARRAGKALTIRWCDALKVEPDKGERYDCVWHDIWPVISVEYKPEYTLLLKRWGRRCQLQDAWAYSYVYGRERRTRRRRGL